MMRKYTKILLPPKNGFHLLSLDVPKVKIQANPAMKIQNYTKIYIY